MSSKQPNKRNIRKTLLRRFEGQFDLKRLDYSRRSKPPRDMAKVTGVIFAGGIYIAGFGVAYYSWTQERIDTAMFNNFAFIFMIPATVVGAFAFLLSGNRREFPIREDIRAHVTAFEGAQGTLWRYEPLLKQVALKKINIDELIKASREGTLVKMAPEDICAAVHAVHQNLSNNNALINTETLEAVENNFTSRTEEA